VKLNPTTSPITLAIAESGGKYELSPHLIYLDDKLRDLAARRIDRLIVNMPPRHGKSTLVGEYFVPWYLGNFPDHKVMYASYEANYAAEWGLKARDVMERVGHLFNHNGKPMRVNPLSRASAYWKILNAKGGMQTSGVKGSMTGKGADLLIIDDPVKNEIEASSKLIRNRTINWYRSTAFARLEPNAVVIIIQTRWHHADLSGIMIRDMNEPNLDGNLGDQWEIVKMPGICDSENDLLGRAIGEALWHERYSAQTLRKKRGVQGSYWFSAMYQQTPHDEENEIFKRNWWQYYTEPPVGKIIIQSWDTAMKEGQENDFSVCTTWLLTPTGYYLLDLVRARLIFPSLIKQIKIEAAKWNPVEIVIEDKVSGTSAVDMLRAETRLPIHPFKVVGDKVLRASLISPLCEAGKVFLPEGKPWIADYVNEMAEFPHGEHDDQVDSTSQGLQRLRTSYSAAPRKNRRESRKRTSITDGF